MIIGVDIGASWIKGVGWHENVLRADLARMPKNLIHFKKTVTALVSRLSGGTEIAGIGLGVAGHLSPRKIVYSMNARHLNGFALPSFLSKRFRTKVLMDNDVRCFLKAEMEIGAAKGCENAVGITIGSGLGGALALKGEIVRGAHFTAGEIGHIPFEGRELEDMASAKFLKKNNDYEALGKNLGLGLLTIVNILDPECIVVGGGIMSSKKAKAIILNSAKKELFKHLKGLPAAKVTVKTSDLGDFSPAIGAALLIGPIKGKGVLRSALALKQNLK